MNTVHSKEETIMASEELTVNLSKKWKTRAQKRNETHNERKSCTSLQLWKVWEDSALVEKKGSKQNRQPSVAWKDQVTLTHPYPLFSRTKFKIVFTLTLLSLPPNLDTYSQQIQKKKFRFWNNIQSQVVVNSFTE